MARSGLMKRGEPRTPSVRLPPESGPSVCASAASPCRERKLVSTKQATSTHHNTRSAGESAVSRRSTDSNFSIENRRKSSSMFFGFITFACALGRRRFPLADNKCEKCRNSEKNAKRDACLEQEFFSAAARMKARAEIVAPKRSAEARPCLLQEYRRDEKDGEDDLDVGEYPR